MVAFRHAIMTAPGSPSSRTWRAIWRWHFHAGLLCIPFVVVLAMTGSIYLFKPQVDAWADRDVDTLTLVGQSASATRHIEAALAALPGSRLFAYEVPREADDAVRVHLYGADGTGHIAFIHPQSLELLKVVPHAARFTEIVKTLHGELLAGTAGTILVELAASWAVVMIGTGLYLWWPRGNNALAGTLYPRLTAGGRTFWRDLHAVTGIWISALALFLLITALPWTTVWGEGLQRIRALTSTTEPRPGWTQSRATEHAAHMNTVQAGPAASVVGHDDIVRRVATLGLEPPVRIYAPSAEQPYWRVRSETQNRPRERELHLAVTDTALLGQRGFADRPLLDRIIGIGTTAHEGQLFGVANQLLGLATALGLLTLSWSAIVMWWRGRPQGSLGLPAPPVTGFHIGWRLAALMIVVGILLPLFGVSLALLALLDWLLARCAPLRARQARDGA